MTAAFRLTLVLAGLFAAVVRADEADPPAAPAQRIAPDDPAWGKLAAGLRQSTSVTANFTELRWFSFKKAPTALQGEVRVSAEHGLSLRYLAPEEQTVIIDERGMVLRSASGDSIAPADPRSGAANSALLHGLRLDFVPLAQVCELYGRRAGLAWTLALVPRGADLRRTLGRITVEGQGGAVRRIELWRSATQRVEISVQPPRSTAAFTPEELRRYFR